MQTTSTFGPGTFGIPLSFQYSNANDTLYLLDQVNVNADIRSLRLLSISMTGDVLVKVLWSTVSATESFPTKAYLSASNAGSLVVSFNFPGRRGAEIVTLDLAGNPLHSLDMEGTNLQTRVTAEPNGSVWAVNDNNGDNWVLTPTRYDVETLPTGICAAGWLRANAESSGPLAASASQCEPDLLDWPDCPPGMDYSFATCNVNGTDYFEGLSIDPADFQTSSDEGGSGRGQCSLAVFSGNYVCPPANSNGGVVFSTPGEVDGETYTLEFDLRFVSGTHSWEFNDEAGVGDANGLSFWVPYPGDTYWHHYTFTAPLGPGGPKPLLYVYNGVDGRQEMLIDNMTLRVARPGAIPGLHRD
jgi:hypothetical protein